MGDGIQKYAQQLRQLIDEYYHQQLSLEDYHAQRGLILDQIEKEFSGGNINDDTPNAVPLDVTTSHP